MGYNSDLYGDREEPITNTKPPAPEFEEPLLSSWNKFEDWLKNDPCTIPLEINNSKMNLRRLNDTPEKKSKILRYCIEKNIKNPIEGKMKLEKYYKSNGLTINGLML